MAKKRETGETLIEKESINFRNTDAYKYQFEPGDILIHISGSFLLYTHENKYGPYIMEGYRSRYWLVVKEWKKKGTYYLYELITNPEHDVPLHGIWRPTESHQVTFELYPIDNIELSVV